MGGVQRTGPASGVGRLRVKRATFDNEIYEIKFQNSHFRLAAAPHRSDFRTVAMEASPFTPFTAVHVTAHLYMSAAVFASMLLAESWSPCDLSFMKEFMVSPASGCQSWKNVQKMGRSGPREYQEQVTTCAAHNLGDQHATTRHITSRHVTTRHDTTRSRHVTPPRQKYIPTPYAKPRLHPCTPAFATHRPKQTSFRPGP